MTCTGLCRLVGVAIDRVIDAATDATDAAGAQRARGRVVSSAASWRRPRQICRLCSRHGSCGLVNLIPSCMTPLRTVATPPALAPEATALAAYHLLEVPVAGADNSGRLLGASAAFAAATGATSAAMQDRPVAEWLGLQAPSAARPCKNAPAAPAVPAEAAAALALAARLGSNEPLAPQPRFGHRGGGHSLQDWLGQRRSGAPPPAVGPIDLGARGRHADGQWHYLLTRRVPRAACRVPRRNAQGARVGHVGVALDLSDRFDPQPRALALTQRLEMATSAAGVKVWNVQLCDPPLSHGDEQMRARHGRAPDEPPPSLPDNLLRQVHPDDRDRIGSRLRLLLRRRGAMLDMDLRHGPSDSLPRPPGAPAGHPLVDQRRSRPAHPARRDAGPDQTPRHRAAAAPGP